MPKTDWEYKEYHERKHIYFVTITREEYMKLLRAKQELDTIRQEKRGKHWEALKQWWYWLKS